MSQEGENFHARPGVKNPVATRVITLGFTHELEYGRVERF